MKEVTQDSLTFYFQGTADASQNTTKGKPASKQLSAETRTFILETQLRVNSDPKKGDIMKKEEETPIEPAWKKQMKLYGNLPGIGRQV